MLVKLGACCLKLGAPKILSSRRAPSWSGFSYPICTGPYSLDPRSNYYKFRLLQVYAMGAGLKFYNLHQTLNTSINALNSFLVIYLISSAKSGLVFFISFTSFFLILIMSSYRIWDVLSSLLLGAWTLVHWWSATKLIVTSVGQWTKSSQLLWLVYQAPWSSIRSIA